MQIKAREHRDTRPSTVAKKTGYTWQSKKSAPNQIPQKKTFNLDFPTDSSNIRFIREINLTSVKKRKGETEVTPKERLKLLQWNLTTGV